MSTDYMATVYVSHDPYYQTCTLLTYSLLHYNAYPISTDIKYAGTIMKNPHCEYQIADTYKNLTENVDYISINHKTYTHIVGLNNYYGSCDIPK